MYCPKFGARLRGSGRSPERFLGIVRKEAKNFTSPRKLRFNLLTDTDYDYVRSLFLRNDCRARIRRSLRLKERQARLQVGPNRARIAAQPRLYSDDPSHGQ